MDIEFCSECEPTQNYEFAFSDTSDKEDPFFHEKLFSKLDSNRHFAHQVSCQHFNRVAIQKASSVFARHSNDQSGSSGGSVKVEAVVTWGGQDDPQFKVSLELEGHDNHGNSGTVKAEEHSDGKGEISASGKHEK